MSVIFLWSLNFKLLERWFSTRGGVGGGAILFPRRDLALFGDIFYCHDYSIGGVCVNGIWWVGDPGMPPSILQGLGQHPQRKSSDPNVSSAQVERFCLPRKNLAICFWGFRFGSSTDLMPSGCSDSICWWAHSLPFKSSWSSDRKWIKVQRFWVECDIWKSSVRGGRRECDTK